MGAAEAIHTHHPDYLALAPNQRDVVDLAVAAIQAARRIGMSPLDLLDELYAADRRAQFRLIQGGQR